MNNIALDESYFIIPPNSANDDRDEFKSSTESHSKQLVPMKATKIRAKLYENIINNDLNYDKICLCEECETVFMKHLDQQYKILQEEILAYEVAIVQLDNDNDNLDNGTNNIETNQIQSSPNTAHKNENSNDNEDADEMFIKTLAISKQTNLNEKLQNLNKNISLLHNQKSFHKNQLYSIQNELNHITSSIDTELKVINSLEIQKSSNQNEIVELFQSLENSLHEVENISGNTNNSSSSGKSGHVSDNNNDENINRT